MATLPQVIPPQAPVEVVTLKDVEAYTTNGGTFTSGSWQTRPLNTLVNPASVTWVSLVANQFTLQAGSYHIWAVAPAYKVDSHVAKVYNITDSVDQIIGSNSKSAAADTTMSNSLVDEVVVLASAKTFELQHFCTTTRATDGFGVIISGMPPSTVEVYAMVRIMKL